MKPVKRQFVSIDWDGAWLQVQGKITNEVSGNIRGLILDETWYKVRDEVWEQVCTQIWHQLKEELI